MSRQEFPKRVKLAAWQRCKGHCEKCGAKLYPGKFRYDHDHPDTFGGHPGLDNCRVLCLCCDSSKTYTRDIPAIAKSNRVRARHLGIKRAGRPMPGSRASGWKHKINGEWVRR